MTPCLADETIAAWTAGALTDAERERAIEHAASCSLCRAVVGHLMAPSLPADGRIGRYEIRGPLGAGGMGVVLRGHDATLGRDVAIKMMRSTLIDPAHRERMLGEAQAMAKVRHPNVVTVHELGEAGDELYVAMELVDGTMLQRWLESPRPRAQRVALVLDVGRGITAVHAAGLLHRDIKPDNIIVRADATPVLVDFGLARSTTKPALGVGSGIAGTPRYMAPEVAAGAPASAASDQYQWWTLVDDALPDDRAVARLVERGHDPDPSRRFPSMADAVAALDRATRPARRTWWIAAAIAAAVLAAAIVVVATRDRAAAPACDAVMPKGWTLARREALSLTLQRAGLDPGRVLGALDRRVASTMEQRERACRDTGAAARAQWTRRLVCVDETWARTGAAIEKMESSSGETVRDGAEDLGEVPPIERCGRGSLPAVPEEQSPEARAKYVALSAQLREIESDTKLRPRDRTAKVRALAPQIEQLDYAPLTGRWHWSVARTLHDGGDDVAAAAEYDLAAQAGLAAGEDGLYVHALIFELKLVAQTASADRVLQLETQAEAGVQRLGNPALEANLVLTRAAIYHGRSEHAKARELYEKADAIYQKLSVAPMAMHVAVLQNLGAVCLESGDLACAQRALDRAVELAHRRYTDAGPEYWETRAARAVLYMAHRDFAKAEAEMRAAADGLQRTRPSGTQIGRLRAYICQLLMQRKEIDAARAECAASVASLHQTVGEGTTDEVWSLTMSGQVELTAKAYPAAVAFLERAVAIVKASKLQTIEATTATAYYAIALLAVKRAKEARAVAVEIAPVLRAPELAESRRDFVRAFPDLTGAATTK